MNSSKLSGILASISIIAVLAVAAWRVLTASGVVHPTPSDLVCDIQAGPCNVAIGNETLVTDLTPRPIRAGEELAVQVELQSKRAGIRELDHGEIEFDMPGMNMGDHTFALAPSGAGGLSGTVKLADCPSGHTLWRATIRLPDHPEAQFTFHVVR